MQLFYCPDIIGGSNFLDHEESRHCMKVLRKNEGDCIHITDGLGNLYTARLTELNAKKCSFEIQSTKFVKKADFFIHIAIAPTKNSDKMEWFVEKSIEIGIDKITFVTTSFSERKTINLDRMRKKAISAMKQSLRAYLPDIYGIKDLNQLLKSAIEEEKIFSHLEGEQTPHLSDIILPGKNYIVLIGPEGGLSASEIALINQEDFKIAKIGDYRLRTETAGVVACTLLNSINRL